MYSHIVKNSFKTECIYKSQIYSKILYTILLYLIQMYIWEAVGMDEVETYNMRLYIILSSCISIFIAYDTNYIPYFGEKIISGELGIYFCKPIDLRLNLFCEYMGTCIFRLLFNIFPMIIVFVWLNRGEVDSSKLFPVNIVYFAISGFMAIILYFILSMCLGMLSFWVISIGNLHILLDSTITLFSGSIIPLWLIPNELLKIYEVLPFKYLYYYPISLGCGTSDMSFGFVVMHQLVWCVVLGLVSQILYKWGCTKFQDYGG